MNVIYYVVALKEVSCWNGSYPMKHN